MQQHRENKPPTSAAQDEEVRAQIAFFIWIAVLPAVAAILNWGSSARGLSEAQSMTSIIGLLAGGAFAIFTTLFAAAFIIGTLTRTRAVSVVGYLLGLPIALIVFKVTH